MEDFDKYLDRLVENFYDTGKLVLNEFHGDSWRVKLIKQISNLSRQVVIGQLTGKEEVDNYISMIEKFIRLPIVHPTESQKVIEREHWWDSNKYINIIDRYLNDTNRPINDKLDFHNRIKEISDKLDNTPFSGLKDIIKPFETFLISKDKLEKKQEDETPEVEIGLGVPDDTVVIGDTEETGEELADEETISPDPLSKEEQLENIQSEIDNILLDDTLDERAAEILSLYVPTEEHQTDIKKLQDNIESIKKTKKEIEEKRERDSDPEYNKKGYNNANERIKNLNVHKMGLSPITQLFLNDPCLINGFIYDWEGSPYKGVNNEYERYLNEQGINIRGKGSYFIQSLLKSDNITDIQKNNLNIKLKNPETQIESTLVGTEDICGLEDIKNERDPATIRNTMSRKLKEKFIIEKDDEYKRKIEPLIETSIKLVDSIFNQIVKNEVLKSDFAFIDRYRKLFEIVEIYSEGETSEERYISLLHVVYDLNQLLETVSVLDEIDETSVSNEEDEESIEVESDEETTDPLSKKGILKLIKKIFDNITDSSKISSYFGKVRDSRNARYEKSFNKECNEINYFQKEPGGDKPRLVSRYDNNNMLIEYITGETRTQDIVTELFNEINAQRIRKYDLKVLEPVVLNKISDPTTTITLTPEDLVEVKLTDSYSDYHLSEFFGVYKTSKNKAQFGGYMDRYEEVIERLTGQIARSPIGTAIIESNRDGIVGVFYQDYVFCPIGNLRLSWSDTGQSVSREKRLSIRLQVINTDELYVWKQGNDNCGEFKFMGCEENPGCPQNESTDRIDNIVENFFDTGNFDI